jgi:hypothetical protein
VDRLRLISFRQWAVLSCLAVTFVTAAAHGSSPAAAKSAEKSQLVPAHAALARVAVSKPRRVVLVVGDSLVFQSAKDLQAAASADTDVRVDGRLGTAPCDWTGGAFDSLLEATHPRIVVLAFTGNAGAAAGCVNDHSAYPLAALLSNYRDHLTQLADRAGATGATVVISTPPARNPAVPAPPAVPTAAERTAPGAYYGFQGVPALRALYMDVVNASGGRWYLSDAAALAVSPGFVYTPTLRCRSDDGPCPTGVVTVRTGGKDAIHLDPGGHGAKRFAQALLAGALAADDPLGA